MNCFYFWLLLALKVVAGVTENRPNSVYSELLDDSDVESYVVSPLPIDYIDSESLPKSFHWGDVNGTSFLTKSLNQHIPQYCGSCWAHASLSSLADRIKISRGAIGPDINLSVQYILNCGTDAGSCSGGSMMKLFRFLKENSGFVPYDTCMPYIACSSESQGGFCPFVNSTCSAMNTCRTCDTFAEAGGTCREIDIMPNATIAEFGEYRLDKSVASDVVEATKAEIFARGPVVASINGHGLADYIGGVYSNSTASRETTHAVSITGWGRDENKQQDYWIVRNSWGEYWGEMGFFRIAMGQNILGIEEKIVWATPDTFTTFNFPCDEDGENCGPSAQRYVDPSSKSNPFPWHEQGISIN